MSNEFDLVVKVVIVGDISVGKTSLLNNFLNEEKPTDTIATIGTEYFTLFEKHREKILKINLWDTSGQERYRSITTQYFKGANGVVLVYDVTKRDSFENLEFWITQIKEKAKEDTMIIVLGNKIDLISNRKVSIEEGRSFADQQGTLFMEISALKEYEKDVKKAFTTLINLLADEIIEKQEILLSREFQNAESEIVKLKRIGQEKKKCC